MTEVGVGDNDWWMNFLTNTGLIQYDDRLIFTVGLWLTNLFVFYGFNIILYFMYTQEMFPKYRINGGKLPSKDLIWDCLLHNAKNNFLVQPLAVYFLAYPVFVKFGMQVKAPLPSLVTALKHWAIALAFNDTMFYWAHRALHHPSIYKHIHKKHHLFNYSIGIAATYAHPVEDILANLIPTLGGCCFQGSHFLVLIAWVAFRLLETVDAHCGYSFPWNPFTFLPFCNNVDRHDFHHSHNTGCYGSFGFWDWLCGTDKTFNDFVAEKNKKSALEGAKKKE